MADSRPPIPSPIQREVRQRCAFGCVFCGCPLYEYHHIESFAEVGEHTADNLTLLCDGHHKQATNGLLTHESIKTANDSPHNVRHGVSSPFGLNFHGSEFHVAMGGNRFSGAVKTRDNWLATVPVTIDDIDLIWIKSDPSGNVYLHANIFDEYNLPILTIVENCFAYRTEIWDIVFVGRTLTIREASKKFLIEITFEPPNQITIDRARLLFNGVEIIVRKSHVFIVNSGTLLVGNTVENCAAGLQIGHNSRQLGAAFSVPPTAVSRYQLPPSDARKRELDAIARAKDVLESLGEAHDFFNPT